MANIQMGTANGSTLGNPPSGDFYIFIDSNNANAYTLRDTAGTDTILGGPNPATLYGLYSQTAQSATITGIAETSIVGTGVGSLTVPANFFVVGDSFHGKIGGKIGDTSNGDDITVRIKAGGIVLASTGLFTLDTTQAISAGGEGWECELDFTIATIGATGSICTNGNFAYSKTNDKKVSGYVFQDVQSIDTTVSNTLDVTVEWNQTGNDIYSANFVLFKTY